MSITLFLRKQSSLDVISRIAFTVKTGHRLYHHFFLLPLTTRGEKTFRGSSQPISPLPRRPRCFPIEAPINAFNRSIYHSLQLFPAEAIPEHPNSIQASSPACFIFFIDQGKQIRNLKVEWSELLFYLWPLKIKMYEAIKTTFPGHISKTKWTCVQQQVK